MIFVLFHLRQSYVSQAIDTLAQKKNIDSTWEMTTEVIFWLPHTWTCMHMHICDQACVHKHTHAHMHAHTHTYPSLEPLTWKAGDMFCLGGWQMLQFFWAIPIYCFYMSDLSILEKYVTLINLFTTKF